MHKRAFGLIALLAASAAQAAEPPTVIDVLAPVTPQRCDKPEGDEIVICAERGGDGYRIDPAVLAADRARQSPRERRPPAHHALGKGGCGSHGPHGCPGEGAIPVSAIALTAVQVAVLAAKGEDWRAPLRTKPDEYRLYQQARARNARDRKARIGVDAAPSADPRPGQ